MAYRDNQPVKKDPADLIAQRNLIKYYDNIQRAASSLVEGIKKEVEDNYTGEPLLITRYIIDKDAKHLIPIVRMCLSGYGWRAYHKRDFISSKFLIVPNNETSMWKRTLNEIKYRFMLWME